MNLYEITTIKKDGSEKVMQRYAKTVDILLKQRGAEQLGLGRAGVTEYCIRLISENDPRPATFRRVTIEDRPATLHELRHARGYSRNDLSHRCSVSVDRIRRMEVEGYVIDDADVQKIARALQVSRRVVLAYIDEHRPPM